MGDYKEAKKMLQGIEASYFGVSLLFIFLGLFSLAWLVIHIEHGRHISRFRVASSIVLGAILIGFGIHFLLLSNGL
jgi:threonine/homoserine/homoserine lactone efflux protein